MNTIYINWQMYIESKTAHRNIKETLEFNGIDATVEYLCEHEDKKYASITSKASKETVLSALKPNSAYELNTMPEQGKIITRSHREIIDGEVSVVIDEQLTPEEIERAETLKRTSIPKLWIRRAMRALGNEEELDALLLANPYFAKDWADAVNINLNDAITASAIIAGGITQDQINAIKIKAYELERTTP